MSVSDDKVEMESVSSAHSPAEHDTQSVQRSDSPAPSCVSMKSDWSRDNPLNFREEMLSTDQSLTQLKTPDSPAPSCVSMKSDWSRDNPLNFRKEMLSTDQSLPQLKTSDSPAPSCVSMKSDWSRDNPLNFRKEMLSTDQRIQQERERTQSLTKDLADVFQTLEENIITFMKHELKSFRRLLTEDISECFESLNAEESRAREGALKITQHFLRNMKHKDLADSLEKNDRIVMCQRELKSALKRKYQTLFEGVAKQGNPTLLNKIYTELHVIECGGGEVNTEHEVRQIETASRKRDTQDTPIQCNDIFKPLPDQDKPIRTVLTKGVAGIGKTVSVQKFILDWAEGRSNQDVHFMFPLPFRELNLMKGKKLSLMHLLHHFLKETKKLTFSDHNNYKVAFIFDGVDECRLPLDFQNNEVLCDVTQPASVDVLLTNLIKGNLLPSALLWTTSRPAAANVIPPECVDRVTEVRGFSDPQKEEYFRKRVSDQNLASRIISHMKASRSLYIMCHIPVFCWISATVLEGMLGEAESGEIPKTLTQMYIHFLIFQTKQRNQKYDGHFEMDPHWNKESILSLGKLAFHQLEKGNLIFYEEDLRESGIDVKEASVYSGVCTQIFREDSGLHLETVYSFLHLSIQEFLAALFVFLEFTNNKFNPFVKKQTFIKMSIFKLHRNAVDKAQASENGHLDLFLRFLLGLSLESNQTLLRGLLTQQNRKPQSNMETVSYIKEKISENTSPGRSINLFHCLNELNDHSLVEEIQSYLSSGRLTKGNLSPGQWSALVFVLVTSEKQLDEFDLRKFDPSEECLLRVLPVVKAARRVLLPDCSIAEEGCSALASALSSNPSHLRELDLSGNKPGDSGVKQLSALLKDPRCKLEKLMLWNCSITEEGCAALSSALSSNPSHLRELNLRGNKPGDSGVKQLSALLRDPRCKLQKLMLCNCSIAEEGCSALASALSSNPSHLRELDLSGNKPGDSGVTQLSALLKDPLCQLETLMLCNCSITEEGCSALTSALCSNPSHLRELDLSGNKPGDSGVKQLSALLKDPRCKLEKLTLCNCSITEGGCVALASALRSNTSHLRELDLSGNKPGDSEVKQVSALLKDPRCQQETQT